MGMNEQPTESACYAALVDVIRTKIKEVSTKVTLSSGFGQEEASLSPKKSAGFTVVVLQLLSVMSSLLGTMVMILFVSAAIHTRDRAREPQLAVFLALAPGGFASVCEGSN
jgi:hypothetical protein